MNLSKFAVCATIAIAFSASTIAAASDESSDVSKASSSSSSFTVQMHDGRIVARDLLTGICSSLGLNTPHRLQQFDWTINVDTPFARKNLAILSRVTKNVLSAQSQSQGITFSVDRAQFDAQLHKLGKESESWLRQLIDAADIQSAHHFGITCVCHADSRSQLCGLPANCRHVVILVHGLDNPGFIWRDVIPLLQNASYTVLRFDYPNDGPIAKSAELFATELKQLRQHGITNVDVIAHSMGGLVTRDLLTRAELYAGNGLGNSALPAIDRFIMVGTPNHGSQWARLHPVSEFGEQLIRMAALNGKWDGFSADGNGEAEQNLLPGSKFLTALNARPLPIHTHVTIIAGRWLTPRITAVQTVSHKIDQALTSDRSPCWARDFVSHHGICVKLLTNHVIEEVTQEIGDGVVTLESAHLAGVTDFNIVSANHVKLLFGNSQDAAKSALPLIMDRLQKPASD